MSRKWERMVEKNKKSVNKMRVKQGKEAIAGSGSETMQTFKGRIWIMPSLLIGFSAFYFLFLYGVYPHDSVYWLTGISYLALGILTYLFRRPIVRIGRHTLSVRRFSGDQSVEAHEIEEIAATSNSFNIKLKGKRRRWVYSKFQHHFQMDELIPKIKEFADRNHVLYVERIK